MVSSFFAIQVRATDNGAPPKYSERHLHLSVVSDGSNAKAADPKSLKIISNLEANPLHISAADPIGHRVGLVEAMLEDGDDGRRIWFYLLSKLLISFFIVLVFLYNGMSLQVETTTMRSLCARTPAYCCWRRSRRYRVMS